MVTTYKNDKREIEMYTDGGSRGNPGPAAIGVYIPTLSLSFGMCIGVATNNEAEYRALVTGLEKILAVVGDEYARQTMVWVRMDSELIVKQMNGLYKVKHPQMRVYYTQAMRLVGRFASVVFEHVRREKNAIADKIVNEALDGTGVCCSIEGETTGADFSADVLEKSRV